MKKLYYVFLFIMLFFAIAPEKSTASLINVRDKNISVEIKGEVENEGVFVMEKGSNISDILDMAIVKDNADLSSINLTTFLANHDVIVIPKKQQETKISINTASLEELVKIPSIGEVTAQKIIDYRNNNGGFQSIEDLINIKGIGVKKLEKMKEYICL